MANKLHKDLDDSELHVPKGFAAAAAETTAIKNTSNNLDWVPFNEAAGEILFGTTNPLNTLGKDGDTFINTISGDMFKKVSGVWVFQFNITSAGGISAHNQLTGLGVDDHTQYLTTGRHNAISGNPHGATTGDISEGSNLYYTEVRVSANSDVAANSAFRSGVAIGYLHHNVSIPITTATISLPFNTTIVPLENISLNAGKDEFTINTSNPVTFHMEPQFGRTTGGGTETIVLWYEISTDGGTTFVKGESIFKELASGDSSVSPLTAMINEGSGTIVRFRAQGTSSVAGLEFAAAAAATITSDHPIVPSYILTIQ